MTPNNAAEADHEGEQSGEKRADRIMTDVNARMSEQEARDR